MDLCGLWQECLNCQSARPCSKSAILSAAEAGNADVVSSGPKLSLIWFMRSTSDTWLAIRLSESVARDEARYVSQPFIHLSLSRMIDGLP